MKKNEQAIFDATEALKLDPKNIVAFINRGVAYNRLRKYAEEVDNYTELLNSTGHDNWFALRARGEAYRKKGDYDQAISDLSDVLRRKPDDYEAFFQRGYAYRLKREYDKAIEDLKQALDFNPDYGAAYYQRGLVYKLKGDAGDMASYERAIADFEKAESISWGGGVYLYLYRGQAYAKLGKYKDAIDDYKKAIDRDPKMAEAYRSRAEAYRATGKTAMAIEDEAQAQRNR